MPVSIEFGGRSHALAEGESVLDALLRNGEPVSHSCRAGSCGSCLLQATQGAVPARAQQGLKESWKARGYFLACVCHPEVDLAVSPPGAEATSPATIFALNPLSADVLEVRLRCEAGFEFYPGQYLSLVRPGGLARSYSIASLASEDTLALHVRLLAGGQMSNWLRSEARVGEPVQLVGPAGECFYVPGREDQPLLMIGTGTGLAPLYGIVRDALRQGHRGPIHLYHGALNNRGLYLQEELTALAAGHPQFAYTATTLENDGPVDKLLAGRHPDLTGWRGFVCGDPALVSNLRKRLFLSGMASRDIHADAFLPSSC